MSDVAVRRNGGDVIEAVITKGDLSRLTPQEKTQYYAEVCRSVGLNPFTRPFEYISLSGKLTLYARREATDQLRRLNGISLEVVSQEVTGDILTVHVRAKDKSGRTDEDFGSVNIAGQRGEALANSKMKALTKAKRRVTLSISGLGFLDESEIEDIPRPGLDAIGRAAPDDTRAQLDHFAGVQSTPEPQQVVDWETGEVLDAEQIIADAREAASRGRAALREHLRHLSRQQREALRDEVGTAAEPGPLLAEAERVDAAAADAASVRHRPTELKSEHAPTDAAQDAPAATETPADGSPPQRSQTRPVAATGRTSAGHPTDAAPAASGAAATSTTPSREAGRSSIGEPPPRSTIWEDDAFTVPLTNRHGGVDWQDWIHRIAHLCTEATTPQLEQLKRDNATTLQRLKVSNRALYDEAINEFERGREGRPE